MIKLFWEKLLTTIWFVPVIISTGLVISAIGLLSIDQHVELRDWPWTNALQIGVDGIRQVLVVTTGAIISLTGVVFSISVVALTLAANQFGSKILYNFLRDNKNKIVLGLLIGSFLYGLTLLSFIDTQADSTQQIPIISVIGSLLFTVLAIIGLIYFIHNISTTIQADQIISLIGQELNQAIEETLFDFENGHTMHAAKQKWDIITQALPVETIHAATSGYVEFIDFVKINNIAEKENQHIELLLRPGDFIIENAPIIRIYDDEDIGESQQSMLKSCISLGRKRTPFHDIEFAIMQLLQIALRALSPGINDSLTAISCIDWLSSSLGRMVNKRFPHAYLEDQNGIMRIKKPEFGFADAANTMFHPLRQNARGNVMVMLHLLETISRILLVSKNDQHSQALFHHAILILETAKESFQSPSDRNELDKHFEKCQAIFEQNNTKYPDLNQSAV